MNNSGNGTGRRSRWCISCCIVYVLLLVPVHLIAQSPEYRSLQDKLTSAVKTVNTSDSEISQTLDFNEAKPFIIRVASVTNTKKEKLVEEFTEVSLADINAASVAYKIQKDVISLNLITKVNQKLVTRFKNGLFDEFSNKVTLYAENVENARNLVDILTKAIPLAEKLEQAQLKVPAGGYTELAQWLQDNIKTQELGTGRIEQSLVTTGLTGTYQKNTNGKNEEIYVFNWGDFNPKSVNIDVKSGQLNIGLQMSNKKKYIRYTKDQSPQNNEEDLVISGYDVEWVKKVKLVLDTFLPLAEQRLKQGTPTFAGSSEALNLIRKQSNTTLHGKSGQVVQQLNFSCGTSTLQITRTDKNEEEHFHFNPADINEQKLDLAVKGNLFQIELAVLNNRKFINYLKNGQKQNYTNSLTLESEDIEPFRHLSQALKKEILICRSQQKALIPGGGGVASWLVKTVAQMNENEQNIQHELVLEKDCSIKYSENKSDAKKPVETAYESNLKDLNASLVEFDVSGKSVFVSLYANNKEKIIKAFKDGSPSNYVNAIKIETDGIESARHLAEGFKEAIKGCKK